MSELNAALESCKSGMEEWVRDRYRSDCGTVAAIVDVFRNAAVEGEKVQCEVVFDGGKLLLLEDG